MGAIQNLLLAGGTAGLGGLILRATVQLRRIANERAKQDGERDGARWTEIMEFNGKLQERVDGLEKALFAERESCDKKLKELFDRIEGLQKMLLQNSASTGRVIALPANAPTTTAKFGDRK